MCGISLNKPRGELRTLQRALGNLKTIMLTKLNLDYEGIYAHDRDLSN